MLATMTDFISVHEAAKVSGYSENYVRDLAKKGKIRAEKKGNMFWVHSESLRAYMAAMKEAGTQRFNWRRKQ